MRKLTIFVLATALTAGCAHSPDVPARSAAGSPCRSTDLPACEAGLADSLRAASGGDTWVKAYIDARADALGPQDPWVALWTSLGKASPEASVVLTAPGQGDTTKAAIVAEAQKLGDDTTKLVVLEVKPRPLPKQISEEDLMLALAQQAGVEQISWIRGKSVVRVLGVDRFAPLVFKVPALLVQPVDGSDPQTFHRAIAEAIRMDHLVNEALAHLAAGSYGEAAAIAVQLDSMIKAAPNDSALTLRANLLVHRSTGFGTEFPKSDDKEGETTAEDKAAEPKVWELGTPEQGAYAAWLRVMMAGNDANKAWVKHRTTIAGALTADRLEMLDLLYAFDPASNRQRCEVEKEAMPAAAWSGDPLFANRLAFQAKTGAISLADWARAYNALVTEAEQSGTVWSVLPSLLYERGELPGMSARGSKNYQRVTRLAVEHLRALERFQRTAPDKYAPSGQLAIALQPGALADPAIAEVLHRLVADNVKYKLAPAATAEDLLETSVVLGLMGAMLPDPIRGAYLISLRKGLNDKLQTGFAKEDGWDVAALYALNALGAYLLGDTPDLSFAGDNITRALESNPDIKVRPIALIAARGVHYGTLIATKELEPERVGNVKLGAKRQAARDRLESGLRAMADDPNTVPRAPLGHLTTLIDGLIATTVLIVEKSPKDEAADTCAAEASAKSLPEVQRNLRALKTARDALLRDPALRAGKTVWARRAALLAVVASDIVDVLSAPQGKPPAFSVPPARARDMVTAALTEWTSRDAAVGVASFHALARDLAAQDGEWQDVVDARRDDIGKVLLGTADLIGATEGSGLAKFVVSEGARVLSAPDASSVSDAAPKIVDVARTLFAANRQDQGTVALLVAGAIGSDNLSVMSDAEQMASNHHSPAAWYLATRRAVRGTKAGSPLDAAVLERGLRSMSDDACKVAQVEPLINVGRAVQRYARGEGKVATDVLDNVLKNAEDEGLVVPRVQYQLDEVLDSGRTFRMSMHMSAGQGFISENSFNVGFDVFSTNPVSGLKVEIPAAVPEDAGRYYAHVASLASIYHLLDGRNGPAARDAERMLNAMLLGVRLGDVVATNTDHGRWIDDLDTNIYVAAELASQRGHVLLAGDMWRVLYGFQTKRPVGEAFEPPESGWDDETASAGLRAVSQVSSLQSSVKESRTLIERAATCDPKQRPVAPAKVDTCQHFRHAISMWRAGVYEEPPAMGAGAKESCVREAALIDVMKDLQAPAGHPTPPRVQDKISHVIATTAQQGYVFDALVMLRYVRDRGLCIPSLVDEARKIGRRPDLTPHGRVDWIGYTLTCPGRQADESVWNDLKMLATSSQRIADPEVPYKIHTAVVRYMVNLQAWDKLAEFSRDEGFVRLMNLGGPSGAAMALLIQHAADILAGNKPDIAGTQDTYDVACIQYGNTGREMVCRELGTLRNRVSREPDTDLKPGAEQLLRQVVGL